jgi:hypothetical protein
MKSECKEKSHKIERERERERERVTSRVEGRVEASTKEKTRRRKIESCKKKPFNHCLIRLVRTTLHSSLLF